MRIFGLVLLLAILAGCSEEPTAEKPKEEVKQEKQASKEETTKVVEAEPEPAEITFVDFDKKYTRDTEETQYPSGLFELKDGTRLNADYITYSNGDYFDYAMAVFYEGKLARLKLETSASIEEVEQGLESLEGTTVNQTRVGYEIVFDERFATDNIAVLPSEWN